jgi:hypothetical protein
MLFLGPTGVGKTHCARAIAKYLFGDADRLLRFDMNEFVAPGSAARLAGTFDQPEGLLTGAVRRQPFAVILLDEIEKADPEVFDLLLQVLDDGRLTDALGRTVDFANTLILLTSNLGVREAQQSLGFRSGDAADPGVYTRAAQRFFRPEFFNRLDRIVAFSRLDRASIARIAEHLIAALLHREGLVRRRCILRIEAAAMERIIDVGFDPVLGARALRRAIEQQLAQPVAARLAVGLPGTITVLGIYPQGERIVVDVQGLEEVAPLPADHRSLGDTEDVLHGIARALRRIEDRFAHLRPVGEITAATLAGEHVFYFVVQEQIRMLRQQTRELREILEEAERPGRMPPALPVRILSSGQVQLTPGEKVPRRNLLGEMAAAQDLSLYLAEVAQQAVRFTDADRLRLVELAEQAALLEVLAAASDRPSGEQVVLYLWSPGVAAVPYARWLARRYAHFPLVGRSSGADWWGLEQTLLELPESVSGEAILVRGLAAERLTAGEVGTHLFCLDDGSIGAVQMHAWVLGDGEDPGQMVQRHLELRREWLAALERGEASVEGDPLRSLPVVRIYEGDRHWIDLRTGQVGEDTPRLASLVLTGLPLPAEVRDAGR